MMVGSSFDEDAILGNYHDSAHPSPTHRAAINSSVPASAGKNEHDKLNIVAQFGSETNAAETANVIPVAKGG